jgi:hypothetical protein
LGRGVSSNCDEQLKIPVPAVTMAMDLIKFAFILIIFFY